MDIKDNWLSIIVVSISILLIALVMAFIFKKIARINTETAILSVIPGALTQMLVMAEQDKRANLLVVSLTPNITNYICCCFSTVHFIFFS